jgi:hypothetical protein
MAARRKPRKSPARRTTATAKIRVHTDEYGRKVYSIVGTKKFAYTLAKAKEIASKSKAGKKRASTKKSTALTTTRKRKATTTKRRTTARRTTGAKRNAKGQFVKAGRKGTYRGRGGKRDTRFKGFDGLEMDEPMTAAERRAVLAKAKASNRKRKSRRTTRRNPTGAERLGQSLDDRIFNVSVVIREQVGEREKKVRSIRTGKTLLKRVPEYTDVVYIPDLIVRGRSAAIREAERLASEAIGAENFRRYFYREDVDRGVDAGLVEYQTKMGTDRKYAGYVTVEPLPEDYPVYKKRELAVGAFI